MANPSLMTAARSAWGALTNGRVPSYTVMTTVTRALLQNGLISLSMPGVAMSAMLAAGLGISAGYALYYNTEHNDNANQAYSTFLVMKSLFDPQS